MTTTIQIEDNFQKYMSFLAMYDMEGNLIDAFCNLIPMNEMYKQTHEDILVSGAENVRMSFADASEGGIVNALMENKIDKVNLIHYSAIEMAQEHPEWFIEE